jgi:hypothetical protein
MRSSVYRSLHLFLRLWRSGVGRAPTGSPFLEEVCRGVKESQALVDCSLGFERLIVKGCLSPVLVLDPVLGGVCPRCNSPSAIQPWGFEA